jgi:homoserine O-acetyltransferase
MNVSETIDLEAEGEVGLVRPMDYVCNEGYRFEDGQVLPQLVLRYETYGRLNEQSSNAILICHALSGDHHAAGIHTLNDRKPGWWNTLIGPGKPLDTNRFFVICANCLGGCQGSSGPSSLNPDTGEPYGLQFPQITIRDMVRTQQRLVASLGIEKLFAIIGGSMGGMQVLQWAIEYPDRVERILPMATTARQNAQAIAFNEVGRSAIRHDPDWQQGNYDEGKGPRFGLSIARMMAHITYLSDKGLENKFGRNRHQLTPNQAQFDIEFEVESYLRYQGQSFVNRFDANTYLYFTKALDRFDLYGPNGRLEETLCQVQAKTLVIGFTSDWLFPPAQNRAIAEALLRCGKAASYAQVDLDLGHDSFLVNSPELFRLIRAFLNAL